MSDALSNSKRYGKQLSIILTAKTVENKFRILFVLSVFLIFMSIVRTAPVLHFLFADFWTGRRWQRPRLSVCSLAFSAMRSLHCEPFNLLTGRDGFIWQFMHCIVNYLQVKQRSAWIRRALRAHSHISSKFSTATLISELIGLPAVWLAGARSARQFRCRGCFQGSAVSFGFVSSRPSEPSELLLLRPCEEALVYFWKKSDSHRWAVRTTAANTNTGPLPY